MKIEIHGMVILFQVECDAMYFDMLEKNWRRAILEEDCSIVGWQAVVFKHDLRESIVDTLKRWRTYY